MSGLKRGEVTLAPNFAGSLYSFRKCTGPKRNDLNCPYKYCRQFAVRRIGDEDS